MSAVLDKVKSGFQWRAEQVLAAKVPGTIPNRAMSVLRFVYFHHALPHLRSPETFSEHLLRLKVSSDLRDVLRQFVTDKEYLKIFVKGTIGDEHNVRTIAILRNRDDVLNFAFPTRCVIKPTHMSGQVILRHNSEPLDMNRMLRWFDENFFYHCREENYRYLHPKIIVEEFLDFENTGAAPVDYKIFCFRGAPKIIQVDLDRFGNHCRCFVTPDWKPLPFSILYPIAPPVEPPANLGEMLRVASEVSGHFDSIRVDLYTDGSQCLVGEMTNCHESAEGVFSPVSADRIIGRLFTEQDLDLVTAFSLQPVQQRPQGGDEPTTRPRQHAGWERG